MQYQANTLTLLPGRCIDGQGGQVEEAIDGNAGTHRE